MCYVVVAAFIVVFVYQIFCLFTGQSFSVLSLFKECDGSLDDEA